VTLATENAALGANGATDAFNFNRGSRNLGHTPGWLHAGYTRALQIELQGAFKLPSQPRDGREGTPV
jgi:hypothetical protein